MSLRTLLTTALLATSAVAQYGSSWGSMAAAPSCPAGCQAISSMGSSTSSSSQLVVQVVSVSDSNGSLSYFPNNIEAPVGSMVQFQFHVKNHTVSESSFAAPCEKIASNLTSVTHPGLHSGFVPVSANGTFTPVYNVLINDTKPIWVYCGQTNHCQKGMAMVINQNSSSPNTIEKYISNAMALALTPTAATQATTATATVVAASVATVATVATAVTEATTATEAFGAATTSATVVAATTAVDTATIAALTSTAATAPAVFTGAAVPRFQAREVQAGLGAGLVLGALVAVW
ncbi:hypothetical protein LTR10_017067 [Elasticomyces elasticus]|uniref:Phytocyanin domain-containing protein n=1 Tax=Exophiala sideris TaxID=1016849 RepID=A0ABR0IZU3_9EURO|nr:hypothetical protein LTR10_017067 [Elasticomyces elasticus]KAK5023075.1 hypothetical protein LTS07_009568 [Exophiala sideris]KAK5026800.1 hypothetical protein LTR13_009840 [Exophiala sideris]KAK5052453.1 hypothetical protein LTR69_009791 [Exophiala sideris]KAK5178238.1 hypothetical protein LTR44_009322 [Eurotiomycetes sp. CCFEE 6388]